MFSKTNKIKMAVIPSLKATSFPSVLTTNSDAVFLEPYITGSGSYTYLCGSCSFTIYSKVSLDTPANQAARCPKCQSYNVLQKGLEN